MQTREEDYAGCTPAGRIALMLRCGACMAVVGPIHVNAVIDSDGDLAWDVSQAGSFIAAHRAPQSELLGRLDE